MMRFSKYDRKHWSLFFLSILVCIPFALFMSFASQSDLFGANDWLTFGVYISLGAGVWSVSLLWWKSLDDHHRQGHQFSWYHGGMFGAFAFLIWLIATNDHHTEYSLGSFHMLLAQLAAALTVYAVWKIRGRGTSE